MGVLQSLGSTIPQDLKPLPQARCSFNKVALSLSNHIELRRVHLLLATTSPRPSDKDRANGNHYDRKLRPCVGRHDCLVVARRLAGIEAALALGHDVLGTVHLRHLLRSAWFGACGVCSVVMSWMAHRLKRVQ